MISGVNSFILWYNSKNARGGIFVLVEDGGVGQSGEGVDYNRTEITRHKSSNQSSAAINGSVDWLDDWPIDLLVGQLID